MKTDLTKDFEEDIHFKKLVSRKSIISRPRDYHWRQIQKLHGEVRLSNMYDEIIHISKFTMETDQTQKAMLNHWRDTYSNKQITAGMEISPNTLTKHMERLGIPKKQKTGGRRSKPLQNSLLTFDTSSTPEKKDDSPISIDCFKLIYNGVYTSEEINKIMTKLQLLVDGEEVKFKMSISLEEVTK